MLKNNPTIQASIAVIGGSGLSDMEGLKESHQVEIDSPFGESSAPCTLGVINGTNVAFLPRHGLHHQIPPSEINYRANIDVLKRLGVEQIIAINAVGSLREGLSPGTLILPDQFIDRTRLRVPTFFETGCVAHVSMADPICGKVLDAFDGLAEERGEFIRGGKYIVIEGPQFSTRAESEMYRSLDCDIIGMTAMPEARLAREAQICYGVIAMVTDYDCWHFRHDDVEASGILEVMASNRRRVERLLTRLVPLLAKRQRNCICAKALTGAIVTPPDQRDLELCERLMAVAGRDLRQAP